MRDAYILPPDFGQSACLGQQEETTEITPLGAAELRGELQEKKPKILGLAARKEPLLEQLN